MTIKLKKISEKLEEISVMLDDLRELTNNSILADGFENISAEFYHLSSKVNNEDRRRQELEEVADRERMVLENVKSIFAVYDTNELEIARLLSKPKKSPFILTLKYNMELNGFDFSRVTLKDETVADYAVSAILADLSRFKNDQPSVMQRFLDRY